MPTPQKKPVVIVTRKLPDVVETRMCELFDARLNVDDKPIMEPGPRVGPLPIGVGSGYTQGLAASSTESPAKILSLATSAASGSSPARIVSTSSRSRTASGWPG